MTRNKPRGRPPLAWLNGEAVTNLAPGTCVSIEQTGRHSPRTVGRVTSATANAVQLATAAGPLTVLTNGIRRARVVDALYEPGDPVLRRGVDASEWRGGVVRTEGTDVLVEQIDGTFAWNTEEELEPAEARDQALPAPPRGPIPAVR